MQEKINFYERLGVPEYATAEEIRKAYREAARRFHPDVNIEAGATEHFLDIKEAYEILINAESRASYDSDGQSFQRTSQPVRIDIQYSRPSIHHSKEQQLLYALLEIDIIPDSTHVDDPAPPLNISLILDTSTSMKGARLDVLKATAIEFVRNLRPQDIVSIISFNDKADIALPARSRTNPKIAEGRIHGLQARGGTEIFNGLQTGYDEVLKNYKPSNTNHIILITDGHTYGDGQDCQNLADDAANKDIGLSSLGIGGKWNDVLLDDLATRTGGDCFYVNNPKEISNMLTKKLTRLQKAYAERLCLEFECGQNISLNYAFRLLPEVGVLRLNSPFKLGSLSKSGRQQILFEFVATPIRPEVKKVLLFNGIFSFDLPSSSSSFQVPVDLAIDIQQEKDPAIPPGPITKALAKLTLYRMQELAKKDISDGKFSEASARLKNVATHLASQGESELARTVLAEAEHIKSGENLSEEGKKQIKYGTRSLLLPVGNE